MTDYRRMMFERPLWTAEHMSLGRLKALFALASTTVGLTDFELEDRTDVAQTSIGKRRGELVAAGLCAPVVGLKRPNPRGAMVQVWCLTEAGFVLARELKERIAA